MPEVAIFRAEAAACFDLFVQPGVAIARRIVARPCSENATSFAVALTIAGTRWWPCPRKAASGC